MFMTTSAVMQKLSQATTGILGTITGILLAAGAAQAFSLTTAKQYGTLWSTNTVTNNVTFSIKAPLALSDVQLDVFAFGDFNQPSEYLNVFGSAEQGTPNFLGKLFATAQNQYQSEITESLKITANMFNSWQTSGSGKINIILQPSNGDSDRWSDAVNNIFDDLQDEYAYLKLSYQEDIELLTESPVISSPPESVPEPTATLSGLAVAAMMALFVCKRKQLSAC